MPNEKISKADFVRAQSRSLSVAEVVKKAKERGISISDNYVYAVRSKSSKSKRSISTFVSSEDEKKFLEITLTVGLSRAETLLEWLREQSKVLS